MGSSTAPLGDLCQRRKPHLVQPVLETNWSLLSRLTASGHSCNTSITTKSDTVLWLIDTQDQEILNPSPKFLSYPKAQACGKELEVLWQQLPTAQVGNVILPIMVVVLVFFVFWGVLVFLGFFSVVGDLKRRSWNSAAKKLPSCLGDQQERVGGLCIPQCWQERFFFLSKAARHA